MWPRQMPGCHPNRPSLDSSNFWAWFRGHKPTTCNATYPRVRSIDEKLGGRYVSKRDGVTATMNAWISSFPFGGICRTGLLTQSPVPPLRAGVVTRTWNTRATGCGRLMVFQTRCIRPTRSWNDCLLAYPAGRRRAQGVCPSSLAASDRSFPTEHRRIRLRRFRESPLRCARRQARTSEPVWRTRGRCARHWCGMRREPQGRSD